MSIANRLLSDEGMHPEPRVRVKDAERLRYALYLLAATFNQIAGAVIDMRDSLHELLHVLGIRDEYECDCSDFEVELMDGKWDDEDLYRLIFSTSRRCRCGRRQP